LRHYCCVEWVRYPHGRERGTDITVNSDSDLASPWEYVDFNLEIGEQKEFRTYPISVHSPEGEAQEEMRFPFDEWELKDQLKDVEFALLRSGGSRRRIGTPEEQTIQVFGKALFEALLVGEVGTHYRVSWREARRQNKGLRVKLHVKPPELSSLPWEFVYDPQHSYLGLSSRTPLVRYPDVPHPIERLRVTPPLRILGMVASPQGLPQLDVGHEKRLVEEALRVLQARKLVDLTWLEGQTWRELQRAMRRGPWHVLHFIGHGGFDPETEEGAIALSDEEGRKHLLGASDLALLLDDHYFLRLVFLNSCEGARGSPRDAFSSTAATLVRAGIPAVVAMQYEITDRAAIEFSRSFYDAVADRLPIDAAVAEARTAVKMGSALEWGTPVLYMRSEDGLIFDIPPKGRDTEPAEPTEEGEDQEGLLRRYREGVESARAGGELDVRRAERLRNLADELGLTPSAVADIEREVMGDTVEAILERHEQAAREEDRRKHVDELYGRARGLHRDREWQAVADVFAEINAEDPDYPDPEGLFMSARGAIEMAQKKQDTIRRYREAVEWAWADENLNLREVKRLRDLVTRLELNPNTAADIEREVMGETKEAILGRREQASAEQYRKAVGEAWTDNELNNAEAKWLNTLASELGLSTDSAADIERDVMGDTIAAILQRQRRLDELYTQAHQSHDGHEWQVVVDVFERIHSEDPAYPDPEGLLASAREALDRMHKVAGLYEQALRYVDSNEWQQARECFEEVQRLEPGYQDTEELLLRVRRELASSPTARVPDLSGRDLSQANSALTSNGLKLGVQREAPSDTVPAGQIIEQSPEAGREVEVASLVSVTVSSGSTTVAIPELAGKSRSEIVSALRGTGLEAVFGEVPNADVPKDRIIEQRPRAGEKAQRGSILYIDVSSGPQKVAQETEHRLVPGAITVSNANRIGLMRTLRVDGALAESLAFSPDGQVLAVGGEAGKVRLWRVEDGTLLRIIEHGERRAVRSLTFSSDGQILASSTGGKFARLWRVEDGTLLREVLHGNQMKYSVINSVAFSPDGQVLATGGEDSEVRLWRVEDGTLLRQMVYGKRRLFIGRKGVINSVIFSPDGRVLATSWEDSEVQLWRVEDGTLLREMLHGSDMKRSEINSVAFSPDGQLLATGGEDFQRPALAAGEVRLWRVEDGALVYALEDQKRRVDSVAFSPDGQMLAAGGEAGEVRLWRVEDGTLLHQLLIPRAVHSLAFSTQGRFLASAEREGYVELWCELT
jgi:WD40 repeat protein/tetratricopeptide (TPR) repeat protein